MHLYRVHVKQIASIRRSVDVSMEYISHTKTYTKSNIIITFSLTSHNKMKWIIGEMLLLFPIDRNWNGNRPRLNMFQQCNHGAVSCDLCQRIDAEYNRNGITFLVIGRERQYSIVKEYLSCGLLFLHAYTLNLALQNSYHCYGGQIWI